MIKKYTICIFGGSGFIGNHLAKSLLKENIPLKIVSRVNNFGTNVKHISTDKFLNEDNIFLDDVGIIINCIGESSDEKQMKAINVHLLEKVLKKVKNIKQFIQLSSIAVYGDIRDGLVTEETHKNPTTLYHKTKLEAEELLKSYSINQGFKYTIIRPSKILGNLINDKALLLLIKFIRLRLFFFVGEKQSSFNYVDYRNLVNVIKKTINNKCAFNETFIISDYMTLNEAVSIIKRTFNVKILFPTFDEKIIRKIISICSKIPFFPLSQRRFDGLFTKVIFSTKKIENRLHYNFEFPLKLVLPKLLQNLGIK